MFATQNLEQPAPSIMNQFSRAFGFWQQEDTNNTENHSTKQVEEDEDEKKDKKEELIKEASPSTIEPKISNDNGSEILENQTFQKYEPEPTSNDHNSNGMNDVSIESPTVALSTKSCDDSKLLVVVEDEKKENHEISLTSSLKSESSTSNNTQPVQIQNETGLHDQEQPHIMEDEKNIGEASVTPSESCRTHITREVSKKSIQDDDEKDEDVGFFGWGDDPDESEDEGEGAILPGEEKDGNPPEDINDDPTLKRIQACKIRRQIMIKNLMQEEYDAKRPWVKAPILTDGEDVNTCDEDSIASAKGALIVFEEFHGLVKAPSNKSNTLDDLLDDYDEHHDHDSNEKEGPDHQNDTNSENFKKYFAEDDEFDLSSRSSNEADLLESFGRRRVRYDDSDSNSEGKLSRQDDISTVESLQPDPIKFYRSMSSIPNKTENSSTSGTPNTVTSSYHQNSALSTSSSKSSDDNSISSRTKNTVEDENYHRASHEGSQREFLWNPIRAVRLQLNEWSVFAKKDELIVDFARDT